MTSKLERYRRRLETSLAARFYLRFHVSLMLVFSILCGWLADLALLNLGLARMLWRYPLAVMGAYLGFLAGVRLWIEYSGIREYLNERKQAELVGDAVNETASENLSPLAVIKVGMWAPEGCLLVALVMIPTFFFGGYVLANAAVVFSEIVLELLLVAGLIRGVNRVEASGWILGTLNATYWSLVFTLTATVVLALWVEATFPGANTLADVVARW